MREAWDVVKSPLANLMTVANYGLVAGLSRIINTVSVYELI